MNWKSEDVRASRGELHWYAVYVRSRHERVVEGYLKGLGYTVYVPRHRVWSRRQDRRQQIIIPAFPGYLFVQCELTPERRAQIKKSPNVIRLVDSAGLPAIIPAIEVESIRLVLESELEVELNPYFNLGDEVRIISGKMKGAVGRLMRISQDQLKLVVSISLINGTAAVVINAADVDHREE